MAYLSYVFTPQEQDAGARGKTVTTSCPQGTG